MNHVEHLVGTAAGLDGSSNEDLLQIVTKTYQFYHEIFIEIFDYYTTEKGKLLTKGNEGDVALTYGEIDFNSFLLIAELLNVKQGDVFIDLGSGFGKSMIIMHLLYGNIMQNILGIELLGPLHEVSVQAIANYSTLINSKYHEYFQYHTSGISPKLGDIRTLIPSISSSDPAASDQFNWTDATIIFCNSTLFPPELMDFISTAIEENCRVGIAIPIHSFICVLTHSFTRHSNYYIYL